MNLELPKGDLQTTQDNRKSNIRGGSGDSNAMIETIRITAFSTVGESPCNDILHFIIHSTPPYGYYYTHTPAHTHTPLQDRKLSWNSNLLKNWVKIQLGIKNQ